MLHGYHTLAVGLARLHQRASRFRAVGIPADAAWSLAWSREASDVAALIRAERVARKEVECGSCSPCRCYRAPGAKHC